MNAAGWSVKAPVVVQPCWRHERFDLGPPHCFCWGFQCSPGTGLTHRACSCLCPLTGGFLWLRLWEQTPRPHPCCSGLPEGTGSSVMGLEEACPVPFLPRTKLTWRSAFLPKTTCARDIFSQFSWPTKHVLFQTVWRRVAMVIMMVMKKVKWPCLSILVFLTLLFLT